MMDNILVIGCGLTGSVIARHFADKGVKVDIWERRDHIAGNMFDYIDEHGVLVQKYGPHAFHTNSRFLYDYISRYGNWKKYILECMAVIDGKATPAPFNFQTIDDFYSEGDAERLKNRIKEVFGERDTVTVLELLEHPDKKIFEYAQFLFDKDYSLYTAKQWGVSPSEIDPSVLRRVPLYFSYERCYFKDKYQVMPSDSFTDFFKRLLDNKNISVSLDVEALSRLKVSPDGKSLMIDDTIINYPVIYTGALDELFECTEGTLPYRSLKFDWKYENIDSFQDAPVVAYPQAERYTRITEYKKLPEQKVKGTTYAVEYPVPYVSGKKVEPYYPVLTEKSQEQYTKYQAKAERIKNLFYCGRLADFKYYNMDQALERALTICKDIEIFLTRAS